MVRRPGLEAIIIVPAVACLALAGLSLYLLVLKPVDAFVDRTIRENLLWMSGSLYSLADREVDELNRAGLVGEEKVTRIRQISVLISFEDFARQNGIGLVVFDRNRKAPVFDTGNIQHIDVSAGHFGTKREGHVSGRNDVRYYYRTVDFVPWKWRITLLTDASAYSSLLQKTRFFYLSTGTILIAIAIFLAFYLKRAIAQPIRQIVTSFSTGETPTYKGTGEFEYLSESIARMMGDLQAKTEQLEATLENMGEGITVFDSGLRLVAWNNRFVELYDYPEELIQAGRSYAEILRYNVKRGDHGPGDLEQQIYQHIQRATSIEPPRFETRRLDGSWLEISRSRMPGGGFVTTYNDITERKQAQEELTRHRDHLEELVEARTEELLQLNQRLEGAVMEMTTAKLNAEEANHAKSRFLASVSHDLRTPLNAIIGFTRLVMKKSKESLPEKQYENLEKIALSAHQLLALINDILDYTRTEEVRCRAVQLEPLFEECLRTVEPMIENRRVQLLKEIGPDVREILTDRDKLKRILINLLSNAVEFTEEGNICLSAQHRDGEIKIVVKDTGIGIQEGDLARIFEEFQKGEAVGVRRQGGTGLGLTICRRFGELLGGRIEVRSETGVGSTFTLTIPANSPSEAEPKASPDAKPKKATAVHYTG